MKRFIDKYQPYLPVVILIIYTYGYAYYKTFFWLLGIEIEHYITLSDLIFASINLLLFLAILALFTEAILDFILIRFLYLYFEIKYRKKEK